jgi:hypothetical protein
MVTRTDSESDIITYLPAMVQLATFHAGVNTGTTREVRVPVAKK